MPQNAEFLNDHKESDNSAGEFVTYLTHGRTSRLFVFQRVSLVGCFCEFQQNIAFYLQVFC